MRVNFISKLLNINGHEWPRVIVSWIVTFFLRVGFVVGWTVVIAMFVNRMGIEQLPLLFIINALLVIFGTIFFSKIIEKVRREILIIINIIIGATLLLSATMFVLYSNWLFFGLVLLAQSLMLAQVNILISLFVEEFFTPLESQRTFPIIESSETLGAIAGGLIVSSLAYTIPSYKFLYIWILLIMLVIPIMLSLKKLSTDIPSFDQPEKQESSFVKIKNSFQKAQKFPFLKGLIVVIMLQWMFINLLEFQYMKSVQENVYNEPEQTIVYEKTDTNYLASVLDMPTITKVEEEATASSLQMEETLTAKLGLLQVIFGCATLFMQLFISSRILKSLGIIRSMSINPLMSLIALTSMALRFNILTASISKGTSEMFGVLFQNAYHSSYYAFGEKIRDRMKELLEGIIKPSGAILGMSLIVLLENFLFGMDLTLTINIILAIIAIISTVLISSLQDKYTAQSHKNIEKGNHIHTRINAIEILGQKGHKIDNEKLIKIVQRKNEDEEVQLKALDALREIKSPDIIPDLLSCLGINNPKIRLAVVETLGEFENLEKQSFFKSGFGQYRIQKTLKDLFEKEEDEEIRSAIIKVLTKLDEKDIIPFLLKKLASKDEKIIADCVYICGFFHDANSVFYLEKYLDHKNPKIRANAIIALWQFKKLQTKLNHYLEQLLESTKKETRMAGVYVISELKLKEQRKALYEMLKTNDSPEILFALGQLSERPALTRLIDYVLENKKDWKNIENKINKLPKNFLGKLKQFLYHEVTDKIHKLLISHCHLKPEEFDKKTLEELRDLYEIIDENKVKNQIKKLMNNAT